MYFLRKNNKRKKEKVAAELTSLSASSYYLVNYTVQRPNATLSISLIKGNVFYAKKKEAMISLNHRSDIPIDKV